MKITELNKLFFRENEKPNKHNKMYKQNYNLSNSNKMSCQKCKIIIILLFINNLAKVFQNKL